MASFGFLPQVFLAGGKSILREAILGQWKKENKNWKKLRCKFPSFSQKRLQSKISCPGEKKAIENSNKLTFGGKTARGNHFLDKAESSDAALKLGDEMFLNTQLQNLVSKEKKLSTFW